MKYIFEDINNILLIPAFKNLIKDNISLACSKLKQMFTVDNVRGNNLVALPPANNILLPHKMNFKLYILIQKNNILIRLWYILKHH